MTNKKIKSTKVMTGDRKIVCPGHKSNVRFSITTTEGTKPIPTRPPQSNGSGSLNGEKRKTK